MVDLGRSPYGRRPFFLPTGEGAGGAVALCARRTPSRRILVIVALGESRLHNFLALASKMCSQNMGKPAGVAPLQRVQDCFVFLDRKRPMPGGHRRDEPRAPNAPRYRFIKSGEHGVVCRANDALMDQSIATVVRLQVARAIVFDHIGLQRRDFVQLLV